MNFFRELKDFSERQRNFSVVLENFFGVLKCFSVNEEVFVVLKFFLGGEGYFSSERNNLGAVEGHF